MPKEPGINRFVRLLVGAVLLWLTASIAASSLLGIAEAKPMAALIVLPVAAYLAFWSAAIQTLLYSLLMEFCVWRWVGLNVPALLISSLLGLAWGLSAFFVLRDFLTPLLFAGFVAGLTTGLVLYRLKKGRPLEHVPPQSFGAAA